MKFEKRKFFPKYSTVPYQFRADMGDIVYCTDKEKAGCIVMNDVDVEGDSKCVGVVLFDKKGRSVLPWKKIYYYQDANINKLTCLVKVRPDTLNKEFTYNAAKTEEKGEESNDEKE